MRTSTLSLILFGLIVLLALSAVRAEEEEGNSLSEELAESRVARSPDAKRKRKMKKGGKGGKPRRKQKKKKSNRRNRNKSSARRNRLQKPAARAETGLTDTCFEQAMHYMKVWKDIVGNFEKQRKRMIKQNKTGGNKSGKKGLFAPIAHRLVDIGGGNKSNMSCGGSYGNKGAAQLQNLTKTLFDCEISVNASCNPANIPQPNMTFINRCKELVDNFTAEATTCYDKTYGGKKTNSSDACYCWTHNNLNADIDELKTCKANKESAAITAALKNCTAAFGVCRKYEDDASTALSSCSSDSTKLTKKAANLAANNASMTAAKEKMSSLASARSIGSPHHSSRASASSCTEIITLSQSIVTITNQNPQSTKITTIALQISSASVTCSTAEKALLQIEVTSIETAIVSVATVLTTIQEQIETLTGSTASTSQLDSVNAETSTAAPSGSVSTSMPASRTFTYPSSSMTVSGAAATTAAAGSGSTAAGAVCRCGVKKSSRIVGGTEVNPKNKYPWVVALLSNGGQFCGGTLVASKYVVTAAHCMFLDQDATQAVAAANVTVRLGEHDLASTTETTILKDVQVKTIINHENYKPATGSLDNDITVLELMEEVDLDTYTPACLAQTSDATTFDGKNAWVYGWGTTSSGGSSSSVLLEVELPVVTKAACETAMGPMTEGQICAGGALNKDACQGDSGGPLTYESNGQHVLIGDVSYGDGCGKQGKYGVYGRVSFYRTWIEGKMSSPKFCGNTANAA